MPVLSNQKHESFASALSAGLSALEALKKAGLHKGGQPSGFYVYVLVDPIVDEVFYVGKGIRRRMYHHENDCRAGRIVNVAKHKRISLLLEAGVSPSAFCLADNLSEEQAFRLERTFIATIGQDRLTNFSAGTTPLSPADVAVGLLSRVRPFCEMASRQPDLAWQEMYWDVIGGLSKIASQKSRLR